MTCSRVVHCQLCKYVSCLVIHKFLKWFISFCSTESYHRNNTTNNKISTVSEEHYVWCNSWLVGLNTNFQQYYRYTTAAWFFWCFLQFQNSLSRQLTSPLQMSCCPWQRRWQTGSAVGLILSSKSYGHCDAIAAITMDTVNRSDKESKPLSYATLIWKTFWSKEHPTPYVLLANVFRVLSGNVVIKCIYIYNPLERVSLTEIESDIA